MRKAEAGIEFLLSFGYPANPELTWKKRAGGRKPVEHVVQYQKWQAAQGEDMTRYLNLRGSLTKWDLLTSAIIIEVADDGLARQGQRKHTAARPDGHCRRRKVAEAALQPTPSGTSERRCRGRRRASR